MTIAEADTNPALEGFEARVAPVASLGSGACVSPELHLVASGRPAVQEGLVNWILSGHRGVQPKSTKRVAGLAGGGKTAILGSVAQGCRRKNLLTVTFCFSLAAPTCIQSSLIPTLAYRFVRHPNLFRLREHILSAIDRCPSVFNLTVEDQLNSLLSLTPMRQESQGDRSTWPKVITIDGLDECGSGAHRSCDFVKNITDDVDPSEIIRAVLAAPADLTFLFRIILANRPNPTIRRFFEGPANFIAELDLHIQSSEESIVLFMQGKFEQICSTHSIHTSWPPRNITATLASTGSATRLAHPEMIVRCVEGSPWSPQKALEAILESGSTIDSKPIHSVSQLDSLYTSILQSSPNPSRAATWLSLIRSINNGRYGFGTERSFPAFVLRQFLESVPGEGDVLLQSLGPLVKIPSSEDRETPYSFCHKSLFEFLEDKKRSGPLHVSHVHRHELYTMKYLEVCKNKGFLHALPAEQDELLDYFVDLDPFFEGGLLYSGDAHLQCDAEWWVKLLIAKRKCVKIRRAFLWAHRKCSWYRCTSTCSRWRDAILRCCTSAGWVVPSKIWLIRDRFRHCTELYEKYFSPSTGTEAKKGKETPRL